MVDSTPPTTLLSTAVNLLNKIYDKTRLIVDHGTKANQPVTQRFISCSTSFSSILFPDPPDVHIDVKHKEMIRCVRYSLGSNNSAKLNVPNTCGCGNMK